MCSPPRTGCSCPTTAGRSSRPKPPWFRSTRTAKIDVYEYTEGRPQLISSGTASTDTWGGGLLIYPSMTVGLEGVSADGVDVYFSTFDTLVPQDHNGEFIKFYDARTGGGFPFQAPAPPCKAADECHGVGSVGPASPAGRYRCPARQDRQRQIDEMQEGLGQEERQVREEEEGQEEEEASAQATGGPGKWLSERRNEGRKMQTSPALRLALSVLALVVAGAFGAILPGSRAGRQRNQKFRSVPDDRPGRRSPGHRDRSRVREPTQQRQRQLQLLRRPGPHRSPAHRRDREPAAIPTCSLAEFSQAECPVESQVGYVWLTDRRSDLDQEPGLQHGTETGRTRIDRIRDPDHRRARGSSKSPPGPAATTASTPIRSGFQHLLPADTVNVRLWGTPASKHERSTALPVRLGPGHQRHLRQPA